MNSPEPPRTRHLWEANHEYADECQVRPSNPVEHFDSWATFVQAWRGDRVRWETNVFIRYDWLPRNLRKTRGGAVPIWSADDNTKDGELRILWLSQQKGECRALYVRVCRNDELAVIRYLQPRFAYLKKLWEPLV